MPKPTYAIAICLLVLCAVWVSNSMATDNPEAVSARWRVVNQNGIYWFLTPEGSRFYSKGVNVVHGHEKTAKSLARKAFYWGHHFSSLTQWRKVVQTQLMNWGFNTRGGWSDPSREFTLPLMVELDLGRETKAHWTDPFDPRMPDIVLQKAIKLTAPYRNDPRLIGYFTDNEVGWWNGPLFRWYLKKAWGNHTKQLLWQLLYDHYKGDWDRLLQDWVPSGNLQSFNDLKPSGAEILLKPGGQGIHLVNRFTYLCARRYYQLMHDAMRQAHPEALILGDRLPLYFHQDAVRAMEGQVDVLSTNYNADTTDGWIAPYYFDGLQRLLDKPVLVSEFFFAANENRSGNRNNGHLMTVDTQVQRARGLAHAICNFARFPNVVGAHWFQYADEPTGGRADGEDFNMGLVDIANRPYEEVTAAFQALNSQLDQVHQLGRKPDRADGNSSPVPIFRARPPIRVDDNALTDWNKAETRLRGFQTRAPDVPFGDVHLAWKPEGLYLAGLASDYMDGELLAYKGDFPLSETFALHLVVAGPQQTRHHYGIHLLPRSSHRFSNPWDKRMEIKPHLYRYANTQPATLLPAQGHVQQLDKPLPHVAIEAFFPAEWLGLPRLEAGQTIRLNIRLVSFFRARSMALSPPLHQSAAPENFKTFVLQDGSHQPPGPSNGRTAPRSCASTDGLSRAR